MLACALLALGAARARPASARGPVLLPTNQAVTPYGDQVEVGRFPQQLAVSPRGRFLLIANGGLLPSAQVLDLASREVHQAPVLAFFDAAFDPRGDPEAPGGLRGYLPSSGERVAVVAVDGSGGVRALPFIGLGDSASPHVQPTGVAVSPDGSQLLVVDDRRGELLVVDPAAGAVIARIGVGRRPWHVAVHPTRPLAYVSNRGEGTVSIVDLAARAEVGRARVGNNPSDLVVSPDGSRLFVADANSDDLAIVVTADPATVRTLPLAPFRGARPGSSPSGLAMAPDGKRLYVSLAWNHAMAVVDARAERVRGLIPTGYYPSAVAVSPDSRTIYVANMKGTRSFPRTPEIQPDDYFFNVTFGGGYWVNGTVSIVPAPRRKRLRRLTARVRANNGFQRLGRRRRRPGDPRRFLRGPCRPVPCRRRHPSKKIRHVFLVVRENKTFDQELADLDGADGDTDLLFYGSDITPNTHALAEQWVLLDQFYAEVEKSEPGHQWLTAGLSTDWVERTWAPSSLVGFDLELGEAVTTPGGGYLFDTLHAAGIGFRTYGEFLRHDESGAVVPYWQAASAPDFPPQSQDCPDSPGPPCPGGAAPECPQVEPCDRFNMWRKDFERLLATPEAFPRLSYITLPRDHTQGAMPGKPTPLAQVADNDWATGLMVETISHSPIWERTVIFVIEDDPQSGADHIDSHRTVALVIGPYVKRHFVSHRRYTFSNVLATIEAILGVGPVSQFDQLAPPMREVFQRRPDLRPYSATRPAVDMGATNPSRGAAATLSRGLDFKHVDRVPDALLNRILWLTVKGEEPPTPGGRRTEPDR